MDNASGKQNSLLADVKRRAKSRMNAAGPNEECVVKDIYENARTSKKQIRGDTGVIFDESMALHECLWDSKHPERPERLLRVLDRCKELHLIERCKRLPSRQATEDEILLKHTSHMYNFLKSTSEETNADALEDLSSHFDSIYFHPTTFDLSLLAVGSTIELIDNIVSGNVQNGMAIIRPPGHHAMKADFNGFCFFNNVSIAAEYCLTKLNLSKILIVDWDVHHGQGTQRHFYNDPRVLYFSIHRYEYGAFWPNLRESDFDAIGDGPGKGYNFNIPLNSIGMTNADYLAVFQHILIPVALEFQPQLIIVSSGYDAAIGCPEGEMEVTPACYAHLLHSLLNLAEGKVAVVLEGGYCLESLAEGAALTLRCLLGDPCPQLEQLTPPCTDIKLSILNCIFSHRAYWKCLNLQQTYTLEEFNNVNPQPELHPVVKTFVGQNPGVVERYETRGCYPVQESMVKKAVHERLMSLRKSTSLSFPKNRVCYVYDNFLLKHENVYEINYPECPKRIQEIIKFHEEYNLFERIEKLKSRHATLDELYLVHTKDHVNVINRCKQMEDLQDLANCYNSVYFHPDTFACATLAAGSVLQVVDHLLTGQSRSGVCIVRPPGHHAEPNIPQGFCIFNNVAIAATYALKTYALKRILIVDWDVHHGNGTQRIFEKSRNVCYISIHRYDNGTFFPKSETGNYDVVGKESGEGFTVNIPWNEKKMGDAEYATVFQEIIMPIAYAYNPELVFVSAGFDAAVGDPLGGCKVTPEAYGHFTHWLSGLANGRVIICLEGGYNVNTVAYSMTMCTKALLGDPLPALQLEYKGTAFESCIQTIQNVVNVQGNYWKPLCFNQKIPNCLHTTPVLTGLAEKMKISQCIDTESNSKKSSSKPNNISSDTAGPSTSNQNSSTRTFKQFFEQQMEISKNGEMFAVFPLKTCPHLSMLKPDEVLDRINTRELCAECHSADENWICLHCFRTLCGRYVQEHMLMHYLETEHPLTLSFSDLSTWCYPCEAYIDNPILYKYKNLAHQDKFHEELVWSYKDDCLSLGSTSK